MLSRIFADEKRSRRTAMLGLSEDGFESGLPSSTLKVTPAGSADIGNTQANLIAC